MPCRSGSSASYHWMCCKMIDFIFFLIFTEQLKLGGPSPLYGGLMLSVAALAIPEGKISRIYHQTLYNSTDFLSTHNIMARMSHLVVPLGCMIICLVLLYSLLKFLCNELRSYIPYFVCIDPNGHTSW